MRGLTISVLDRADNSGAGYAFWKRTSAPERTEEQFGRAGSTHLAASRPNGSPDTQGFASPCGSRHPHFIGRLKMGHLRRTVIINRWAAGGDRGGYRSRPGLESDGFHVYVLGSRRGRPTGALITNGCLWHPAPAINKTRVAGSRGTGTSSRTDDGCLVTTISRLTRRSRGLLSVRRSPAGCLGNLVVRKRHRLGTGRTDRDSGASNILDLFSSS